MGPEVVSYLARIPALYSLSPLIFHRHRRYFIIQCRIFVLEECAKLYTIEMLYVI